jgi:hypothetical protein
VSNKISSSVGGGSRGRKNNSITNNNNNNITIINNNTYSKNNNNDDGIRRKLLLPFIIASAIGIFGLVSTTLLITTDVNSSYFNIYSFIVQHLPDRKDNGGSNNTSIVDISSNTNNNKTTILSSHWWIWNSFWISNYIFHKNFDFIDPHFDPHYQSAVKTAKIFFIADRPLKRILSRDVVLHMMPGNYMANYTEPIQLLYEDSKKIATFTDNVIANNSTGYPFTSIPTMILGENRGIGRIEIRANY